MSLIKVDGVIVGASGDTTAEEVQAVARRLYAGLAERSKVVCIEPAMEPAPDAVKSGGEVAALGCDAAAGDTSGDRGRASDGADLLMRPGTVPRKVRVKRA